MKSVFNSGWDRQKDLLLKLKARISNIRCPKMFKIGQIIFDCSAYLLKVEATISLGIQYVI